MAGFDYNLASIDNIWDGKFFYHRSFQPDNPDKQFAQGVSLTYSTKHLQLEVVQRSVGENYRAETGYIQRNGKNIV
ncbi:MAG: hypothetical protein IPF54_17800 [Draconibacterium sp.]|nr:hypothetical protein [Draconibacterium sp.]